VPKRDYLALNIPEAKDYKLVYSLDLAKLSSAINYDIDSSKEVTGAFDRIAYFLELKKAGAPMQYAFVSMDAFTKDVTKIGIPNVASKAKFQLKVNNLNVVSNVAGIQNGAALKGGNIEFWPNNYGPNNTADIPGASATLWDFGDMPSDPENGYGCMQVHNHLAKQTIFAINKWNGGGGGADIGIGNSKPGKGIAGKTRDWTFAGNAGQHVQKHLRVLVRMKVE
jgi:sialate O-acetylesterase